ncbi:helix-turn-helix domain-containing protein [Pseudoflavonifractor sp. An85]|uniref:MarR family transcriptional regulator n=1 Tax=Pseudoflavonifractor sp. An85 TaxID=1965661 RepID=UPI001FA91981|nr:helix-turn-helix domain-containing protein [Pseudoflavonifractor sp. An85]
MELEWTDVMHYQQQMQRLIRLLLPQKPGRLTASEWELLSWLYLKPGQNRPMQLSQCSGMKKEAVSRCLKSLSEKGYIAKQPQPGDERSYCLSLTELGLEELKNQCEANLDPLL